MSLENVVCFPGVAPPMTEAEISHDLVGFLRELAEAGEIKSFYGVVFADNGDAVNLMSGNHEAPLEVIGALDVLKDLYKDIVTQ